MRPRVVKNQDWEKDAPPNAIWWTVKDKTPSKSTLVDESGTDYEEETLITGQADQYQGNCSIFVFYKN